MRKYNIITEATDTPENLEIAKQALDIMKDAEDKIKDLLRGMKDRKGKVAGTLTGSLIYVLDKHRKIAKSNLGL
jgi:hypothetical protein